MSLRLVSKTLGEVQISDPDPIHLPELHTFHTWSLASASSGVSFGEAQHPFAVVHGCGQISTSEVFGIRRQGETFEVLSPGAHVTDNSLASDWYPTHLPKPRPDLLLALVHTCTRAAICRELLDKESSIPTSELNQRDLRGEEWLLENGVRYVSLTTKDPIPAKDAAHAHSRAMKILNRSDEIRTVVASGDMLVMEAYYEAASGRVYWPGYWTTAEGGIESEAMSAVLNWRTPESIRDAKTQEHLIESEIRGRKALKDVLTLVIGNNQHILSRIQGEKRVFKADYVVLRCSDSRAGSQMLQAPEGRIEWIRSAGHAMDATTLHGLRLACESAVQNVADGACGDNRQIIDGAARRAVLYVLGHTQCGAIKATLSTLEKSGGIVPSGCGPAEPLIRSLSSRFAGHSCGELLADPQHVQAAEISAVQSVEYILDTKSEDALLIQRLVADGKLLVVPAVYYTSSGIIGQLLDSSVFRRQIQKGFGGNLVAV